MGNRTYALVAMTNKDVYYVNRATYLDFKRLLEETQPSSFFQFKDARSNKEVTIKLAAVSSLVELEDSHV